MKRGLKIILSWICMFSLFASPISVFGASSGDPVWPNPGAIQLSKTAQPTGNPGEWEITLKAEGKNVQTSSDVVLVIDKSGSMVNTTWPWETNKKMANAKTAAKKFVDNLLLTESSTRIAVVSFNESATLVSDFKGPAQKEALKNAIDGINANGGTNIQAGVKNARDLLSSSSAQNKFIVVLSDGEPTYSFKGTEATSFDWTNSNYKFAITKFNYGNRLGNGSNYTLSNYKIDNYSVKDNGIGTISEAKIAKDAGLKIFSVGLEVSNNSNAMNVLKDIQSEGYFPANSDDLNTIFREMAGKIAYAAQEAKVVDPMGDMFNLKKQGAQVGPQDYSASQGTVTWNAATETFTWDIGNIAEGEPATLTYKVVLDQSKNPVSDILYPTNGKTTIDYTNVNNEKVSKDFEVPKVSIGNGSILMKGYKVNANGKPVNAEGVEVEGPEFAELLYSEYYKDQNGNEALPIGAAEYSVTAKNIAGYQWKVGENPASIRLTAANPTPTVWFGYEEAVERTVTVHYLEQGTEKELAQSTTVKGAAGQNVTLTAADVPGYTPVNESYEYTIQPEGNEYTFYYIADKQSVEVQYLEQGTNKKLADSTIVEGVTGQTLELKAIGIPGYTPVEPTFNYELGVENAPHIFYYTPSEQTVTVKFVDKELGNELAKAQTVTGRTGETVTLKAVEVPGYTPENESYEYTIKAEGNNEYTFYYTANKQSVEVQYLEQGTNKKLADPTTVEGVTGQTLELKAIGIPGYTPVEPTFNYELGVENAPHIFYYTPSEQTVSVKFVDKNTGKELLPSQNVPGVTGETVTLKAAEIPGYTPENKTAEYTIKAEGNNEYIFYYTANKQSVEVQYLEQGTNKKLADPTTVEGVTGQTLELKAIGIPGYTPVEPTFNYELGVENAPHIFFYTPSEQTVTVKFVDKELGNELAKAQTVTGHTGETVTLKAVEVPGYTPENKSYEYTIKAEGNNEYTFYYTADKQSVEVQYLEQGTNKKLADPTTVEGVTGQTLELKAIGIPGYTPVEPTYNYELGVENAPHIFYYTANATEPEDSRTLTVRYVDQQTGKDLLNPTERLGKVGEKITLTAVDYTDTVTGAVYKPHAYEVPYTFTEDQVQQFVFNYTQSNTGQERNITIHHVDRETNEELIGPTTSKGIAGTNLVFYPEPISVTDAVYFPEQTKYDIKITLEPGQEYTIYYVKGEPAELAQITVSYRDRETGNELVAQEIYKGRIGAEIDLSAKQVDGYTPEVANHTHTWTNDPNQTYVFFYTKNASADRQLTVKYLEKGTNRQLANPTTVSGKPGETKTLTAVSVSGYTPVKTTDSYTFSDQESQEYTFYYTKKSSDSSGSSGSDNSGSSNPNPSPSTPEVDPLPPLPAVPPTLEMENHYDYINGYPDGTVKPLNNITREEVAAIFYRLLDDESRSAYLKTGNSFSDVGNTRWSNKHISTMGNAGIITGYPDGTFRPGQYITRAEFAAIASRFDKLDERSNDMFTDITGHWAEKYIASAANKGWIKGYADGTFKPDQYITRAEAAKFINSVLNRKVDKDGIHKDTKQWPDNISSMWYYYDILEATNHHEYSRNESGVEVWEEVKPGRVYP